MTPRQRIYQVAVELFGARPGCGEDNCIIGKSHPAPAPMYCHCLVDLAWACTTARKLSRVAEVLAERLAQAEAELGALRDAIDEAAP